MNQFHHQSLDLNNDWPLVYTAMSKHLFYYRMFISKFVLENKAVPLNPFMVFEYFLLDTVERDLVRTANNNLVKKAAAIWVFGPVSNGVLAEIKMAHEMNKPVRYFRIDKSQGILEIVKDEVEMEEEVSEYKNLL